MQDGRLLIVDAGVQIDPIEVVQFLDCLGRPRRHIRRVAYLATVEAADASHDFTAVLVRL